MSGRFSRRATAWQEGTSDCYGDDRDLRPEGEKKPSGYRAFWVENSALEKKQLCDPEEKTPVPNRVHSCHKAVSGSGRVSLSGVLGSGN